MNKIRLIIVLISVILVAGTAYFLFDGKSLLPSLPFSFLAPGSLADESQNSTKEPTLNEAGFPEYLGMVEAGVFTHKGLGFSFALPSDFKVLESEYGEGAKIITVEKSEKEGFQIFVSPFDEPGPLSPERILIDEPDLVIKNPQQATLDGVPALVFESESEIGPTFEIWFVNNGYLYQITTYLDFASGLQEILQTWKFQP